MDKNGRGRCVGGRCYYACSWMFIPAASHSPPLLLAHEAPAIVRCCHSHQITNEDCLYMIYKKEGSDEWETLEIGDPPPPPPEAA